MADFPTEGAPPFINRILAEDVWRAYMANYTFGALMPDRLVLHHTYKPGESDWRGVASMRAMQRFYADKGWTAGPHLYAGPDGIWLATPMAQIGIHAGNGNGSLAAGWYSLGLEMVGYFDTQRPAGRVWAHALAVMDAFFARIGREPSEALFFHRDFSQKSCPGWAVTKAWVLAELRAYRAARSVAPYTVVVRTEVHEEARDDAPVAWGGSCVLPAGMTIEASQSAVDGWLHWPAGGFLRAAAVIPGASHAPARIAPQVPAHAPETPIDAALPILGQESAVAPAQAIAYLTTPERLRRSDYTEHDIREVIVPRYVTVCAQAGVRFDVAIAQMIHETGALSSFWSRRPQRNPAGIGVNGQARATRPNPPAGWAYNPDRTQWEAGLSFPSWEAAIPAHVYRLLGYATPRAQLTEAQRLAMDAATAGRPLPEVAYGTAPTLRQLGAQHNLANVGLPRDRWRAGWAWPGTDYGERLAATIRAMREY